MGAPHGMSAPRFLIISVSLSRCVSSLSLSAVRSLSLSLLGGWSLFLWGGLCLSLFSLGGWSHSLSRWVCGLLPALSLYLSLGGLSLSLWGRGLSFGVAVVVAL